MRRLAGSLVAVALAVAGCGSGDSKLPAAAQPLPEGAEPVRLDPGAFSTTIDNPYWPMTPGNRWIYREGRQRVVVEVTDRTKRVAADVTARVVHDVVTEDGQVVEDTYDWYAQDRDGNVWYLGENTKEYEKGKVTSTKGSWEAGVDGAQAGVIVPARPRAGLRYRQEYYAGEAEDAAEVLSLDARAEVPFGRYRGLLQTKDYTPLEARATEHKYYAKGIGPVLAVALRSGDREELVRFERR